MKVQYVLVDENKTVRSDTCTTCEKGISETTIWYSFRGTDDLCFDCWNVIRKLSIIPENNPNRVIDSSFITSTGMYEYLKKAGLKTASVYKTDSLINPEMERSPPYVNCALARDL